MPGELEILGYDDDDDLMGDDFDDEGMQGWDDDDLEGDFDDDDLMGDEIEILGDDLLGRRRRRRKKRVRRKKRRKVVRRGYSRDRGLVLGFGTQAAVADGATVDFTANPQVPFRAKRVLIDTGGDSWEVADIKIGKNSQLASAGGFPASAFQPNAFDIGVKFDSAYPGIDIVLTMTNNAGVASTATVGMFGYAAER